VYEKTAVTFSGVSPRRVPVVSNAVLGTLMFVIIEAMLFAGLISAFLIVKTSALGAWPPPGQPRLPVGETAFNTVALLMSGALLFVANRMFRADPARAKLPLLGAILLGAFFVTFQGIEWAALLREGLTLTSSTHGSFFYLIVGMHALHAVAALVVLSCVWLLLHRARLNRNLFHGAQIFWYFVVGLWPILYAQVYL
jgi:cytochrome c oxidase subunit 3